MDLLPPTIILIILLTLYLFSYSCLPPLPNSILTNKSILLLIAHPDDEAMFFAPTLLALTNPHLKNHIKVVCLSTGNAEGLGDIRKRELVDSCDYLGVSGGLKPSQDNDGWQLEKTKARKGEVKIIENEELLDDMESWWDEELISSILKQEEREDSSIDMIITFDKDGVSSHKNHISVWKGARSYLLKNYHQKEKRPKLYTLTTVPIWRKYMSYLDLIFTTFFTAPEIEEEEQMARQDRTGSQKRWPRRLVILSNLRDFGKARRAMTDAHKSQMRWFRYGWIWGSKYMVLNELVREDVNVETESHGTDKRIIDESEKTEL